MNPMTPLAPDNTPTGPMNPGVRRTVALLRENGFNTTDSGDGETFAMGDEIPYAWVSIRCTGVQNGICETERLRNFIESLGVDVDSLGPDDKPDFASVQLTWDVADPSVTIMVSGLRDELLDRAEKAKGRAGR